MENPSRAFLLDKGRYKHLHWVARCWTHSGWESPWSSGWNSTFSWGIPFETELCIPTWIPQLQGCYRVLVSLISWPGQLLSLNPCRRPKILARVLFLGILSLTVVILDITAYFIIDCDYWWNQPMLPGYNIWMKYNIHSAWITKFCHRDFVLKYVAIGGTKLFKGLR